MITRPRLLWAAFIRGLIAILAVVLALGLYLVLNPGAMRPMLLSLPLPGVVEIPTPGPTLPPPLISAARGEIPGG